MAYLIRYLAFQRDYLWNEEEWEELWQDIIGLFGDDAEPAHYMGCLVLQSANSKEFDVFDGQQRIATLSLMTLAAISRLQDLSKENEDNKRRAEQLWSSYIGYVDPVTLLSKPKLVLNYHNNDFYKDDLVPLLLEKIPQRDLSTSNQLLYKGFYWFKEKINERMEPCADDNEGEETARFIDHVVDRLFFTVITVTDELNAFKVFETFNARGTRLSSTDLLKNYLFSVVSNENASENELKHLEDLWERIIDQLENESFPRFLRAYWNSKHPMVRQTELFKTIRKNIKDKGAVFDLIRELNSN